jgi:hypothetical protein
MELQNYKNVLNLLQKKLLKVDPLINHWWDFELVTYHNSDAENIVLINLVNSGYDNKYRVYHSYLCDASTEEELYDSIIKEISYYLESIKEVFTCVIEE